MIITGMQYQHYKGGVYKVLIQAINEDTNENMVVYSNPNDPIKWVRPASEFEQKFAPYLPLGSVLSDGNVNFIVVHHGLDYMTLYSDELKDMYEVKIINLEPHYLSNTIAVTIKDIEREYVFNLTFSLNKEINYD